MNLLYDAFPETVQVDGVSYAVYTDFRNWHTQQQKRF